ncbi:FHA domain-containing protein [Demequina iriomotensis]|uniref:FHA domain-containing protein n=1 Tax=Demequina iriomotensis TaxID=1536641 RepID=UPI0007814357|nr:FHA domain-containing protein [Demequina iriomotensis]
MIYVILVLGVIAIVGWTMLQRFLVTRATRAVNRGLRRGTVAKEKLLTAEMVIGYADAATVEDVVRLIGERFPVSREAAPWTSPVLRLDAATAREARLVYGTRVGASFSALLVIAPRAEGVEVRYTIAEWLQHDGVSEATKAMARLRDAVVGALQALPGATAVIAEREGARDVVWGTIGAGGPETASPAVAYTPLETSAVRVNDAATQPDVRARQRLAASFAIDAALLWLLTALVEHVSTSAFIWASGGVGARWFLLYAALAGALVGYSALARAGATPGMRALTVSVHPGSPTALWPWVRRSAVGFGGIVLVVLGNAGGALLLLLGAGGASGGFYSVIGATAWHWGWIVSVGCAASILHDRNLSGQGFHDEAGEVVLLVGRASAADFAPEGNPPEPDRAAAPSREVVPSREPAAGAAPEPVEAPVVIETVPAPVRAPRTILVWDDGTEVDVSAGAVLGRDPAASGDGRPSIAFDDDTRSLSKTHFALDVIPGVITVTDLHSTNGVLVVRGGAEQVLAPGRPVVVAQGDRIVIGARSCELRSED